MKHAIRFLLVAVLVLVCAFALFAQGGPGFGPGRGQGPGPGWQGRGEGFGPGMGFGRGLNLTPEQQKKAQEIFQGASKQQLELHNQLAEQQKAFAAGKPGTDAEIDKRAADRAQLMAKMQATREKAFANFYNNVLTAEQRTQLDKQREARKNFAGGPGRRGQGCPGMGRGRGQGRGMGWGPGGPGMMDGPGGPGGPGMGWGPRSW